MKLKAYIERLNKILAEDPKNANLEVVYSIDDEGNAFHSVNSDPVIGIYERNDFMDMEYAKDEYKNAKANAVCIN